MNKKLLCFVIAASALSFAGNVVCMNNNNKNIFKRIFSYGRKGLGWAADNAYNVANIAAEKLYIKDFHNWNVQAYKKNNVAQWLNFNQKNDNNNNDKNKKASMIKRLWAAMTLRNAGYYTLTLPSFAAFYVLYPEYALLAKTLGLAKGLFFGKNDKTNNNKTNNNKTNNNKTNNNEKKNNNNLNIDNNNNNNNEEEEEEDENLIK